MAPVSYTQTTNPLRDWTTPLVIVGVALFAVGFAVMYGAHKP